LTSETGERSWVHEGVRLQKMGRQEERANCEGHDKTFCYEAYIADRGCIAIYWKRKNLEGQQKGRANSPAKTNGKADVNA